MPTNPLQQFPTSGGGFPEEIIRSEDLADLNELDRRTQPTYSPTFTNLTLTGLLFESFGDNIVAFATGGQTLATALVAEISRITTVVAINDSVRLPVSVAGLDLMVINHGANSMQVFGAGTDTIDDVATALGVPQMAGSMVLYACTTAGKWYSNGIGTGFAGAFPTLGYTNGMTAFATGGQASATLIITPLNRVTVVGTAADSVKLPVAAPGMQIVVANAHATNSLNLFPNTGDAINASAANVAFAIPAGKTASLYSMVAGNWHSVLSA